MAANADAERVTPLEATFGLTWPGRDTAFAEADAAPSGELRLVPDASVRPVGARHALVEGENLAVLRLLAGDLRASVGMIYLDPPYNTGRDMGYQDRVRGAAAGRCGHHSAWLSMMAPRLVLARRLLRDDGLLFVSIDDHEVAHLRMLLDEIFGEACYLGTFVWRRRSGAMDAASNLSADHEYVLCYTKASGRLAGQPRSFARYRNPDDDPRGPWIADNLSAAKPGGNTLYPITDPNTGHEYWPPAGRYWPYNPETMARKIAEGRVLFPARTGGTPMLKRFQREARRTHRPVSTWIAAPGEAEETTPSLVAGQTTEGTRELKRLLGEKSIRYPKPVSLIRALVQQASSGTDLVVDFFAGTATTAQAVFEANAGDGHARRVLCVQQDEPLPGSRFASIAEVAAERMRRVLPEGEGLRVYRFGGG